MDKYYQLYVSHDSKEFTLKQCDKNNTIYKIQNFHLADNFIKESDLDNVILKWHDRFGYSKVYINV